MSLRNQWPELRRLISAFEAEVAKNDPIQLSVFYVTQDGVTSTHKFSHPNHTVMLWQYYGSLGSEADRSSFVQNISNSNLQWGLRGAQLSCFAVIESPDCDRFVRLAQRAGNLFDREEAHRIHTHLVEDVVRRAQTAHPDKSPVVSANDNPLAIWLNYLLYHLSLSHPGRERVERIQPDPYTVSLLALERLAADQDIGKVDRSVRDITGIRFQVAMSFPGEKRAFVSAVVDHLRPVLGADAIFYDYDYQAQLARPNLDTLLQDIYRNRSDLIAVFLCKEYADKSWCGLEWRAIRDIIKAKTDNRVMFVRFDNAAVDGVFSIDGYIDANAFGPPDVARFITQRLAALPDVRRGT